MPRKLDITGEHKGKATAIRPIESRNGMWYWEFECDCGNKYTAPAKDFSYGSRLSCGCLQRDLARKVCRERTTHGEARKKQARLYKIWSGMKTRCNNPNYHAYPRYGGRGIRICKEWEDDYVCFRDWAMKNGYRNDLSIDRIDNDGNYCPENCRWLSKEEHSRKTWEDRNKEKEGGNQDDRSREVGSSI